VNAVESHPVVEVGSPTGLCGFDQLVGHGNTGRPRARPLGRSGASTVTPDPRQLVQ